MTKWSTQTENDLTFLIKDWLKQNGKTQADLKVSLHSDSSRMQNLLEVLKAEFLQGGMPNVVSKLCEIEESWIEGKDSNHPDENYTNPFGQLDLLLQEMKKDCE